MKKLKTIMLVMTLISTESLAQNFDNSTTTEKKNYYVLSKSYGTNPESDPPRYVRQLDKTGIEEFKNVDFIDAGLKYRFLFENRDNDFRRSQNTVDRPILSRTTAYFAVKNVLDPLRFTLEFQDSRITNSKFTGTNNEVNKFDFIQSYAELYFKDTFATNRPVSIRAGRMSFDVLDRKLISRNESRNTNNNFQGFRTIIGEQENDWQLDSFALQPITRLTDEVDRRNKEQWLYGSILNWRRWSDIATLQPFYFRLDQNQFATNVNREIHSPGLRAYGSIGHSNFDYDLISVYQFGENGTQKHRAYGYAAEIGYSFKHDWKPRLSANYLYGSGDKNSSDNKNQRFERFFGTSRSHYIQWENIKAAKTRIEFEPNKKLQIDLGYSLYWLANSADRWNAANLRDSSGNSGDFIGNEFDIRTRYKLTPNLSANVAYAHFTPGEFTKNVGRDNPSDFFYLNLTWSLFK